MDYPLGIFLGNLARNSSSDELGSKLCNVRRLQQSLLKKIEGTLELMFKRRSVFCRHANTWPSMIYELQELAKLQYIKCFRVRVLNILT